LAKNTDKNEKILFINFKNYREATMENALPLAKTAEKVSKGSRAKIILVVNAVELALVAKSVSIPVFAQHIDFDELGKGTGKILPEVAKYYGAKGTVLNHAENKISDEQLQKCIARAKQIGLKVMVCAEDIGRAKKIASMPQKPELIAVEPPELIGGDISVSTAQPEIISDTVREIKKIAPEIKVICGAGIKNSFDVKKAIELGAEGVFVASGIIKAADKEKAIRELVQGFD
jgi:triosephosphate isomerase